MIFHENRLPADDSHEISSLICYFWKRGKIWNCRLLQIIGGALRVNEVSVMDTTSIFNIFAFITIIVYQDKNILNIKVLKMQVTSWSAHELLCLTFQVPPTILQQTTFFFKKKQTNKAWYFIWQIIHNKYQALFFSKIKKETIKFLSAAIKICLFWSASSSTFQLCV